jgi:penicillin-binding protein 2
MKKKKDFVKNHHTEELTYSKRMIVLLLCTVLIAIIILARLYSLQVIHHSEYYTRARNNLLTVIPIAPRRGLIYDRNGVLLAKNVTSQSLMLVGYKVKNVKKTITALKKIIPLSNKETELFYKNFKHNKKYDPTAIKVNLTEQQVAFFDAHKYEFPAVFIRADMKRQYPLSKITTPILGYVGRINQQDLSHINQRNYQATHFIGKLGIEKHYESLLHGTIGYAIAEIDASNKIVGSYRHIQFPREGRNITLSIDSRLQQKAYKLMSNKNGSVVAINPNNGDILAMVSTPSYDANQFVQGINQKQYAQLTQDSSHPLFNRSIRGLYSPGSTIKPFIAYSALKQHIITPQTSIFDPGWFKLPHSSHIFHDWKYNGHGKVNVTKAITVSCDTFFYHLAATMGIKKLDQSLDSFGFGKPTHIDLDEELSGIVPTPQWELAHKNHRWYTGDTVITGIGQGSLLVTPLQLAVATAMLAEHGKPVTPHLILNTTQTGHKQDGVTPSSTAWTTIDKAMQNVIKAPNGTATNFGKNFNYTVAGKTGTVQVFKKKSYKHMSQYLLPKKLRNNHLFIAFAPAKKPSIAIAVVVEHSSDADGIARKFLDYYFKLENQEKTNVQNGQKSRTK